MHRRNTPQVHMCAYHTTQDNHSFLHKSSNISFDSPESASLKHCHVQRKTHMCPGGLRTPRIRQTATAHIYVAQEAANQANRQGDTHPPSPVEFQIRDKEKKSKKGYLLFQRLTRRETLPSPIHLICPSDRLVWDHRDMARIAEPFSEPCKKKSTRHLLALPPRTR